MGEDSWIIDPNQRAEAARYIKEYQKNFEKAILDDQKHIAAVRAEAESNEITKAVMTDFIPKQASIHSFIEAKDITGTKRDSMAVPDHTPGSGNSKIRIIRANKEYIPLEQKLKEYKDLEKQKKLKPEEKPRIMVKRVVV